MGLSVAALFVCLSLLIVFWFVFFLKNVHVLIISPHIYKSGVQIFMYILVHRIPYAVHKHFEKRHASL